METLNIKECIEESKQIIECGPQSELSKYQKITNLPTINHQELFEKMKGKWTSYLGVVGSFSPALNAISFGSTKLTQFDINPLNILNSYLMIAAMLSLNYEDYMHFFFCNNNGSAYSKNYYDKIKMELPEHARIYWDNIFDFYKDGYRFKNLLAYNIFSDKGIGLVINLEVIPNNPYLKKETYEYVKRKLKEVKITFMSEHFGNVPYRLKGEKFDKIYLSCLQSFIYDNVDGYNYFDKLKEYLSLLNKDGVMEGAYVYQHCQSEYKSYVDYFAKKVPMKKLRIKSYSWTDKLYDSAYLYEKQ